MDEKVKIKAVKTALEIQELVISRITKSCKKYFLVGISGAPGTGKSTIAEILTENLCKKGLNAKFCPLDGFHFSNQQLAEMKLSDKKGAIETFDVENFLAALFRLKTDEKPFYWPLYSREIHDPVAEGILINPEDHIFIIEGNYIYFEDNSWKSVKEIFDYKVFLTADEAELKNRLLNRHISGGKSLELSMKKISEVDLPNALKINKYKDAADIIINS